MQVDMDEEIATEKCITAMNYASGNGVPADPVFAIRLFGEVAREGYPCGEFGLAEMTFGGFGTEKDTEHALDLYRSAAGKGHLASKFRLGCILMDDESGEKTTEARGYFSDCAEGGMREAFEIFANFCFYGIGGEQDMKEAYRWYEAASLEGDPVSTFKCAYMLENGIGVEKNFEESLNRFRFAALGGVPEAQFKMASLAFDGKIPGGKAESVRWYEMGTEAGYPMAMFNLATIYYEGDGVEQNLSKAFSLYERVAKENNDGDAYFMIGRMYMEGQGVERNVEKGFESIGKAADAGNQMALQIVGELKRKQNTQFVKIDGTE